MTLLGASSLSYADDHGECCSQSNFEQLLRLASKYKMMDLAGAAGQFLFRSELTIDPQRSGFYKKGQNLAQEHELVNAASKQLHADRMHVLIVVEQQVTIHFLHCTRCCGSVRYGDVLISLTSSAHPVLRSINCGSMYALQRPVNGMLTLMRRQAWRRAGSSQILPWRAGRGERVVRLNATRSADGIAYGV